MRALDHLLRRWRISKAVPWVRPGDRLLDVGCFDRALIDRVRGRVSAAIGVDPVVDPCREGSVSLLRGAFPEGVDLAPESVDCMTALAVVEHVDDPEAFAAACLRVLVPGGRLVVTVPHPLVDRILDLLIFLRLADGMAAEEHHGLDTDRVVEAFRKAGFRVRADRRFQLGLNRLLVFEKPGAHSGGGSGSR